MMSDKRRISEDVAEALLRDDGLPVETEGIAVDNGGASDEGKAGEVVTELVADALGSSGGP